MVGHRVNLAEPKSQTVIPSVAFCIVGQSPPSTLANMGPKIQRKGKMRKIITWNSFFNSFYFKKMPIRVKGSWLSALAGCLCDCDSWDQSSTNLCLTWPLTSQGLRIAVCNVFTLKPYLYLSIYLALPSAESRFIYSTLFCHILYCIKVIWI